MDINWIAASRALLVYTHLLALMAAVAGIAMADFSILARRGSAGPRRVSRKLLQRAMTLVAGALAALWVTGLALITLDTGWQLDALLARPKLQAKVVVVLLLSLNGWLLHRWVFRELLVLGHLPAELMPRATLLGAVSAASWGYAAFLGLAAPFAAALGLGGFLGAYGVALLLAYGVALRFVLPVLQGPGPSLDSRMESMLDSQFVSGWSAVSRIA